MKKIFLLLIIFIFASCTIDPHYRCEKAFFEAQKKIGQLIKDKKDLTDEDYNTILQVYEKVITINPLDPIAADVGFRKVKIYIAQAKYDKAIEELKRIIQNFSSQQNIASQAYWQIGRIYEAQAKWPEAEEAYFTILDLYPLSRIGLEMPQQLIQYAQRRNDPEKREDYFRRFLNHYKQLINKYEGTEIQPVIKEYMARLYFMDKQIDKAIEILDDIIKNYKNTNSAVRAYIIKADVLLQGLNKPQEAINVYKDFVKEYKNNPLIPSIYLRLGRIYLMLKDTENAKVFYNKLINLQKDNPKLNKDLLVKAYLGLSYAYRLEKNTEKVEQIYSFIRKNYPKHELSWAIPFLLGQYYQEIEFPAKAAQAYEKAIEEYKTILAKEDKNSPYLRRIANYLVLCYLKSNKVEQAEQLLRKLSKDYPQDPVYLFDLARLYLNLNDSNKAIAVYEEIKQKFADNKLVYSAANAFIDKLKQPLPQK